MRQSRLIIFLIFIILISNCQPGDPSGPLDISDDLWSLSCLVHNKYDSLLVSVSKVRPYNKSRSSEYSNKTDADVILTINDRVYTAEPPNSIYSGTMIFRNIEAYAGEEVSITANHTEMDNQLTGTTRIPDIPVVCTLPDTLNSIPKELKLSWDKKDAYKVYTDVYINVETDSSFEQFRPTYDIGYPEEYLAEYIPDSVLQKLHINSEYSPQSGVSYTDNNFIIDGKALYIGVITRLLYYYTYEEIIKGNGLKISIQFRLASFDEATASIVHENNSSNIDEMSGFSAPIKTVQNIDGGMGMLGALLYSWSPEIVLSPEFFCNCSF